MKLLAGRIEDRDEKIGGREKGCDSKTESRKRTQCRQEEKLQKGRQREHGKRRQRRRRCCKTSKRGRKK